MSEVRQNIEDSKLSLVEHLEELRKRIFNSLVGLVIAAAVSLLFGDYLVELFKYPYVAAMQQTGRNADLAVLTITAGFTTYLKMSLIAALVLASPWIFYQLWMFVSAGLYHREKRHVLFAAPVSAGLFIGGAIFFFFVVAVPALKFFIFFCDWMGLKLVITFQSHVSLMTTMILVFGLVFQMPLAVLLLAKMGAVSLKTLRHYRRHVIVGIVILGAILTPPDPISQICLALPMWLLYELGIGLVYIFVHRKTQTD